MTDLCATLLLWVFVGCGHEAEPPPVPNSHATSSQKSPAKSKSKAHPEPSPAPAPRWVPPPPAEGLQPVVLVGHGLRIRLYPPFQVARVRDVMGSAAPADTSDGDLIVSWWDVSAPEASRGIGVRGLFNSRVFARPVPDGDRTVQRRREAPIKGPEVVRYQLGSSGSWIDLSPKLDDAGGMLTVEPGPAEPRWVVEAGENSTTLQQRKFMQSADPSKGPGFELTATPSRPWGHWP